MDQHTIERLLADVQSGQLAPDDMVVAIRRLPFADLGFARVDHHRAVRQGLGEVVFGPSKTPEQCVAIVAELLSVGTGPVLLTRATEAQRDALVAAHPGADVVGTTIIWRPAAARPASIIVITAGTSDLPVADECAAVLGAHGIAATRLTDVGVAGIHRLLADIDTVLAASVVVVCAGMDGALASVVGGLTAAPVVAVPTSVGYGSAFEGVTALLSMLASCASGISVVGIDNGFGAAYSALRLLNQMDSLLNQMDSMEKLGQEENAVSGVSNE